MLLNNIYESFNKYIVDTRDKLINTLFKTIRRLLMRHFQAKKEGLDKIIGSIYSKIEKKLERNKLEAMSCNYIWEDGYRFEVEYDSDRVVVDLKESTCGCKI